MKLPNPFQRAIPLDAPQQPGEHKYTTLQLSRVVWRIFRSQRLRALFGLISVAAGVVFAISSIQAVNGIIATRTEGRHSQCVRDNVIRHDAGEAAAKKAQDFIDSNRRFFHTPPATGELLQAEIDYVNSQRQVTLDSYPPRDCSKKGIDAYYKNPPSDPITNCKPDHKGLCK